MPRLKFVYILLIITFGTVLLYQQMNLIKRYDKTLITALYHREMLRIFWKYIRIFYFRLQKEKDNI